MRASVLGTGAWGTALAQVLADNGWDVTMWGVEESQVEDIRDRHINSQYFGDHVLPSNLTATLDIAEAVEGAELLVVAVPSFAVRTSVSSAAPHVAQGVLPVSVSKGFDPQTGGFMSDAIREALPAESRREVVTLAGPSFAVEVKDRLLTAVTAASPSQESAELCQKAFSNSYFRVYTNRDEIGAELCGAIKNVLAIASGCLDGLGLKTNTRSALITRGLLEMSHLVKAVGGDPETVYGLTGLGDLVLTCSSEESRNYQVGKQIGEHGSSEGILERNTLTAEGVRASAILMKKAEDAGVEMPLCSAVYRVLYEGVPVREAIENLVSRPLRSEEDE